MVVTSEPLPMGAVGMAPAGTGTAGGMLKFDDGFVLDDEGRVEFATVVGLDDDEVLLAPALWLWGGVVDSVT